MFLIFTDLLETMKSHLLLAILVGSCYVEAYKILVVSPFPGKSHSILGDGVVNHLSKAGHQVRINYILKQLSNA